MRGGERINIVDRLYAGYLVLRGEPEEDLLVNTGRFAEVCKGRDPKWNEKKKNYLRGLGWE